VGARQHPRLLGRRLKPWIDSIGPVLSDADALIYASPFCEETCMADNKSPNPKRTEIILAWLGMAGAVALMWWLVAE